MLSTDDKSSHKMEKRIWNMSKFWITPFVMTVLAQACGALYVLCAQYLSKVSKLLTISQTLPKAFKLLLVILEVLSQILIKFHLQILDYASTSKSQPNISILTRPSFRISTKIRLHNLNQASAAKYWPNSSFSSNHFLSELKLQNFDQTLCSKSEQNLALWQNFSFQICT